MNNRPPFLTGQKVYLRGLALEDLEGPYVSWLNDAEVCQFNSHHAFPYSREQAQAYISGLHGNRSALVLAVVLRDTDEHIGNISLQSINQLNRSAEFAILMGDKSQWGKGFAKEAGFLLCNHGFADLNLHRIYCGTNEHNTGMVKLAEYLGMQPEGRFRDAQYKAGQYNDTLHFGVLREEFYEKFASQELGRLTSKDAAVDKARG